MYTAGKNLDARAELVRQGGRGRPYEQELCGRMGLDAA
jgi:hypothetical protein